MKDYKRSIRPIDQESILSSLIKYDANQLEYHEGALNDAYIYDTKEFQELGFKLGRAKMRSYLVLGYEYQNCWSNTLYMLLTDSEEEAYKAYEECI